MWIGTEVFRLIKVPLLSVVLQNTQVTINEKIIRIQLV